MSEKIELPPELQAAADLVGDIRGLIIFAREHPEISVNSIVKYWIESAPEFLQAVAKGMKT